MHKWLLRFSIYIFIFLMWAWLSFDPYITSYQFVFFLKYASHYLYFGIDGISLFFLFLTTFFIPLCILYNSECTSLYIRDYVVRIFSIEILLILVFTVMHLFFFYIFFEAILIPFFIMIGIYGSRDRKVHAMYLLFFYTLFGSLLMLISILLVYVHIGTTNFIILSGAEFSSLREYMLWFTFFVSFAIKVPMFPFHIWLPEAHVESPTEGSVILAAILLKVGGYGFLRILLPIFPDATMYYSSFVLLLCVIPIIYTSMSTIRQTDIKRVIAYSSISHMNVALIGIMLLTPVSISGSLLLMLGHGIVSGGLFSMVGMLYDRFKTKVISYYSGIIYSMPIFSSFFFLFILGNISMPSTANFIGEFLILLSAVEHFNLFCIVSISISIFLCSFYSLYLYNRIIFGIPFRMRVCYDSTVLEFSTLLPIIFFLFMIGTYPKPFLDVITNSCLLVSVFFINT